MSNAYVRIEFLGIRQIFLTSTPKMFSMKTQMGMSRAK